MSQNVFSKNEIVALLDYYRRRSRRSTKEPAKIKCLFENKTVWEYEITNGKVSFDRSQSCVGLVQDALDMSGATNLVMSLSKKDMPLTSTSLRECFLDNRPLLIPDTNFIIRHYSSNILAPILGTDFSKLTFRLPRMVVLEIERRGNAKAKENKEELRGKERRLSFYAAKEINFLRENIRDFSMLPLFDSSVIADFSSRAGSGFSDMWIRKEIHDAWNGELGGVIFLTCDLMNSMAAEAEGISSCYFSKLPQKDFYIGSGGGNTEQLFEFLLANAIVFEKIRLELVSHENEPLGSYCMEGVWAGKTTSEWYADCVKRSN
jgi:hypothetical protein